MKQFLPLLAAALIATPAMAQQVQKPVAVQQTARQMAVKSSVSNLKVKAPLKAEVEVLRTLHQGSKGRIDLVRTADGRICKALTREDGRMRISRPAAKTAAITESSLFEDFSGWDGKTRDWLPEDWTEISSNDSIILTSPTTFTWHVEANDAGILASPKVGDYMASIYFASTMNEEGTAMLYAQEDEWLISPEFTPAADEILKYALSFTPFWMFNSDYIDTETWDFTERVRSASVIVKIQVDGGEWQVLNDVFEDYLETPMDDLFEDGLDNSWRTYTHSLDEYVGKKVRIAFHYEGVNGENWAIDYVKVGIPQPEASYVRPDGAFYYGFSDGYTSLSFGDEGLGLMLVPANAPITWYNTSNIDATEFTWIYGYDANENELTTNDVDLEITYEALPEEEYNLYDVPVLAATAPNAETSEYAWNGVALQAGGYAHWTFQGDEEETLFGVGNYDIQNEFFSLRFDEDTYLYGIDEGIDDAWSQIFGAEVSMEGVANYFEKPAVPYSLSSISVLCDADFEEGAELALTLIRIDNRGYLADTIAMSTTALTSDMIQFSQSGTNYTTIPFTFSVVDEDGFETEADLTISDAFMAVVNTKEHTGIKRILFWHSAYPDEQEETNGYFLINSGDELGFYPMDVLGTNMGPCYNSFLFNLYMSYPTDPAASIEQIRNEAPVMGQQFFNINGQAVNGAAKGFIIEKTANGEFRKVAKF